MSFTKFALLPLEIRHAIWKFSLPTEDDNTPEVCIMWPLVLIDYHDDGQDGALPSQPFIVDVPFPAMMHVCRESRAIVLQTHTSGVRFRTSAVAGCPVPFRRFRPELDAMFWGTENMMHLMNLTSEPGFEFLAELRHVAVESRWAFGEHPDFVRVLFQALPKLETLSVVLADSSDDNVTSVPFQAPARRCKLRAIPEQTAEKMTVKLDLPFFDEELVNEILAMGLRVPMSFFSEAFRRQLDRNGRVTKRHLDEMQTPYNCPGWNDETLCFDALELPVVTFVEHRGPGEWAEVCGQRRYPTGNGGRIRWQEAMNHYIPTNLRRNPEEHRVNDDDGHYIFGRRG